MQGDDIPALLLRSIHSTSFIHIKQLLLQALHVSLQYLDWHIEQDFGKLRIVKQTNYLPYCPELQSESKTEKDE
jgi:hypothetical protein